MIEFLTIFTFLLAILAVRNNWEKNRAVLYLAVFISVYSLFVLNHKVVVYSTDATMVAFFYGHFSPLFFLAGPFLYFYFRSITRDKWGLYKKDWIHFMPSVITLIGIVPYLFRPWDEKLQIAANMINDFDYYKNLNVNTIIPSAVTTYSRPLLLLGYLTASFIIVFKKNTNIKSNDVTKIRSHYLAIKNWSYFVLTITTLSVIGYIIVLNVFYSYGIATAQSSADSWQFISAALFALIPTSMLFYPQLVYGFVAPEKERALIQKGRRPDDWKPEPAGVNPRLEDRAASRVQDHGSVNDDVVVAPQSGASDQPDETASSSDTTDYFGQLRHEIVTYFEEEFPYLNPNLRVADVASYLGVPPHHVNFCFSVAFPENFAQFKTRYRIRYAQKMLKENAAETYSIEAVGNMSGFASKSNFFKSFKQATGLTPQEFVLNLQLEKPSDS